ncbi:MAG: hypothetical protein EAZ87_04435 [Nostocales cyanobacterium]|nr:MAG: hypothetical protein EAZ87_04435 [Nostocales cyanobacterium]
MFPALNSKNSINLITSLRCSRGNCLILAIAISNVIIYFFPITLNYCYFSRRYFISSSKLEIIILVIDKISLHYLYTTSVRLDFNNP